MQTWTNICTQSGMHTHIYTRSYTESRSPLLTILDKPTLSYIRSRNIHMLGTNKDIHVIPRWRYSIHPYAKSQTQLMNIMQGDENIGNMQKNTMNKQCMSADLKTFFFAFIRHVWQVFFSSRCEYFILEQLIWSVTARNKSFTPLNTMGNHILMHR